jgi:dihydropteroate synthase
MAILNATPDSFSGDGLDGDIDWAVDLAQHAAEHGADIIDVGGESTRPGHVPVDASREIERVVPVIRSIASRVQIPISIDTSKAAVAEAAIAAGASMINDVRGLTSDPELAVVAAQHGVPVVIMHDLRPDGSGDLMSQILRELSRRLDAALEAGIAWERLIVDPGFGFGKQWPQNLELLRRLAELSVLGRPILVGLSRKKTIADVLGTGDERPLEGTLATTALAIVNGAAIVRVHDVEANVRVARMTDAVVQGRRLSHAHE